MANNLIKKFSLIILTIFTLPLNQIQALDLTYSRNIPTKKIIIGAMAIGTVIAAAKIYSKIQTKKQEKIDEKESLENSNKLLINKFHINKDTVFAFDLHDVVARYNILKMLKTALYNLPYGLTCLAYPKIFPVIGSGIKNKASAQEILDAAENQYPASERLKNLCALGINISAQLKGIQGTIDLMQELMTNGYIVIFASNIEPKLWDRFIQDFPMFKNCDKFIVTPETGWIKKPNEQYFKNFLIWAKEKNYIKNNKINMLFIDDRLKNIQAAEKLEIPSYGFVSWDTLRTDLKNMGTQLN